MSKRVAIVTGAGRGLGSAIAADLAAQGVSVVLAGRTASSLTQTEKAIDQAGGTALSVPTDVTDAASVADLFDTAIEPSDSSTSWSTTPESPTQVNLVDLSEAEWDRIFNTNVRGMFLCSREAGRRFTDRVRARGQRCVGVRAAGSTWLLGVLRFQGRRHQLHPVGRRGVGEVRCPDERRGAGYFATDINAELRENKAAMAKVLRRIPAYRMGTPDELANVVTYLALYAPDFLTGQTIAVDGGESSV